MMENLVKKCKKVFISHATKDFDYVKPITELLEDIGLTEDQLVCSSVPGYGIPLGVDLYDWLSNQFQSCDLHVLFILSDNYYSSAACLNEMGAAWVLKSRYDSILLPGFEFRDIKGAVNPNQISIKLDGDESVLKQHLNELKDNLVAEFGLHMPSASKWERHRESFIDKEIIITKCNNDPIGFAGLLSCVPKATIFQCNILDRVLANFGEESFLRCIQVNWCVSIIPIIYGINQAHTCPSTGMTVFAANLIIAYKIHKNLAFPTTGTLSI